MVKLSAWTIMIYCNKIHCLFHWFLSHCLCASNSISILLYDCRVFQSDNSWHTVHLIKYPSDPQIPLPANLILSLRAFGQLGQGSHTSVTRKCPQNDGISLKFILFTWNIHGSHLDWKIGKKFQSGNIEQTGKVGDFYPKYWKMREFYPQKIGKF